MIKLRCWVSVTFLWLALLLNIERLHEPINLASFVYVQSALLAALLVAWAPPKRWQVWLLTCVSLAVYFLLKASLGYAIAGAALPLTLTEATAIVITIGLTWQIGLSVRQFESSVFELAAFHWVNRPLAYEEMREQLYREVRPARRHHRPLSLVALRPDLERVPGRVDELIAEAHQRMAGHYLDVQFVDVLASVVNDFDLIAKRNDHFLLMLTESDGTHTRDVIDRLVQCVRESLGVDIQIGVATFPEEEVTLAGLVKCAENRLQTVPVPEDAIPDGAELAGSQVRRPR